MSIIVASKCQRAIEIRQQIIVDTRLSTLGVCRERLTAPGENIVICENEMMILSLLNVYNSIFYLSLYINIPYNYVVVFCA